MIERYLSAGALVPGLILFALSWAGIGLAALGARRLGLLLDHAGGRKRHEGAVPLVGGPVLGVLLVGVLLWLPEGPAQGWSLLFGVVSIGAMGLLDDAFDWPAWPRLLLQTVVVTVVVVVAGLQIHFVGDLFGLGRIGLGPLKIPFTVLCLLFLINAVNMLDGMDGLVGSVVLISAVALSLLALARGIEPIAAVAGLLVAALAGFLLYNLRAPWRRRASVYLGDSGSMVLGFVLGWLAIALVESPGSRIPPIVIALVLLFPAADAMAAFVRRVRAGRNPLAADRSHLHHLLLRCGLSVEASWLVLITSHVLWVGLALLGVQRNWPEWLLFLFALVGAGVYLAASLEGRRLIRPAARRRRRTDG